MASIFTFNENPPRVSSPWSRATPPSNKPLRPTRGETPLSTCPIPIAKKRDGDQAEPADMDYSAITRLEAEPQEGPTEYKLHLLLRRRRAFTNSSTGNHASRSLRRSNSYNAGSRTVHSLLSSTPPPLGATQSRQHRLEQLTTQLLWRMQQSCPHHGNSSMASVVLHFPDEASLANPIAPQPLYPGLEESKGALYEIGVADDGELVGLAEDEMEESLNNLRAMASSLGCQVDVVRMVAVGQCEWVESGATRQSKLLVAEAYVHPDLHLIKQDDTRADEKTSPPARHASLPQLRVSLAGATMSGKSSLLGTLSTGTLDNGRGKSRLSLLKHRHEIESGVTSSITQELIGYGDFIEPQGEQSLSQVINYGCTDISSWIDIHASAESLSAGKLVFLTDSAGHPRFRRTTVRGLIGWDPHYTLLCIPADDSEDSISEPLAQSNAKDSLIPTVAGIDSSGEHLHLCLSLNLPLIVVVTKYDLAKKASLKSTLTRVLSALKGVGRTGRIVADPSASPTTSLETLTTTDLSEAEALAQAFDESPLATVPIILTSSLSGTGLRKLHALLRQLPVPTGPSPSFAAQGPLFHIEDVYASHSRRSSEEPLIVGGHLRGGQLTIGDELVLGPYPIDASPEDSDSGSGRPSARSLPGPTSKSFPGALHKSSTAFKHSRGGSTSLVEWRTVRVTSLRNLRLPVSTLHSGQVGTVGLIPLRTPISSPAVTRVRKGMVLLDGSNLDAHKIVTVEFEGLQAESAKGLTVGSAVVVFFASVRAPSKVLSVNPASLSSGVSSAGAQNHDDEEPDGEGFGFQFGFDEDTPHTPADEATTTNIVVRFQFMGSREYVEDGVKVLVMPGGRLGMSGSVEKAEKSMLGLDGFVGRVVQWDT